MSEPRLYGLASGRLGGRGAGGGALSVAAACALRPPRPAGLGTGGQRAPGLGAHGGAVAAAHDRHVLLGNRHANLPALVALALWLGHYLYRTFVFAFLLPSTSRPMPLVVLGSGAFFNVVNAYLNGRWLFTLSPVRPAAWLWSVPFLIGVCLFAAGFLTHVLADRELRRLRRQSGGAYVVPKGSLFRLVSCPNYLGEMIEWTGWAIATLSWPGLVFALWTAANLVPRALKHHAWYRATFADYPRARKAIIPLVL